MSIVIGLIIGAVLGLTGAGGSIFAVPLLILLVSTAPSEAMGIALGAVAVSAAIGAITQRAYVLWAPAAILAGSGAAAAPIGKYLSLQLHETLLIVGFVILALFIATRMFMQAIKHPEFARYVRATIPESKTNADQNAMACRLSPTGQFQMKPRCISGLMLGGLGIGFASGLFGVGGGFLIIPLLLFLSALPMQKAIATSLAVITLVSSVGFVSHIGLSGFSELKLTASVIAGSIIGMLISQRFSKHLAGPTLQLIFSALVVLVVITLCLTHFFS